MKKKMWCPGGHASKSKILEIQTAMLIYSEAVTLKDKNGKEIYEGDIVERKWTINISGEYEHLQESGVVKIGLVDSGDGGWDIMAVYMQNKEETVLITTGEYEVIGNIYENKELLK